MSGFRTTFRVSDCEMSDFRAEFRAEFRAKVAHLSIHTVTLRAPPHAFSARISHMHTVSAREIPRPRTCICMVNYTVEFYRYLSYYTLYGYVQRDGGWPRAGHRTGCRAALPPPLGAVRYCSSLSGRPRWFRDPHPQQRASRVARNAPGAPWVAAIGAISDCLVTFHASIRILHF